ncbi:cation diffusion facilitator family transporter [Sulfurimonas sp.]|nr:cation diffusion facilitator family transporter [Sulfurimonas sp.]
MSVHHHKVNAKNLFIAIILNIIITIAQLIGGLISGSLALLSDAIHNFSDVISLITAYGANRLATRPSDIEKTFGYRRAEIIAALFNSATLIAISIYIMIEAFNRLYHPEPIDSILVIILGILGIIVNGFSVLIVKHDAKKNMNMKAAYLHLLADVMTSVAVVLGGVLMHYFNLFWIDPIISILIAIYLLWASFALLKSAIFVLMHFTPVDIDVNDVIQTITEQEQIDNIHHLHLWQLDDSRIHLEAHLDFNENIQLQESTDVIDLLEKKLNKEFGISHITFQCEYNRCDNKEMINK